MDYRWVRKAVDRGDAINAEILSLDGVIYLALINDEPLKKRDADGQAASFPSAHAAGRALYALGLREGMLRHHSPYDEMIGRGDDGPPPAPLRTPLRFSAV
jgi:hypothetical protein